MKCKSGGPVFPHIGITNGKSRNVFWLKCDLEMFLVPHILHV